MSRSPAPPQTDSLRLPELLNRAAACQRDGRLAEAEQLCRGILEARPNHLDASHLLAIVCHQQGRTAEAVDLLGAALNNYPSAADALCNHGLMLQQLGRHQEALASFDKALAVRPADCEALHSRALACTALGRHSDAARSYDRILAIRPADAEAHNNRGVALNALGHHADALACYDKALAIKPDYVHAHYNRGRALDELQRYDEALACYDKALALDPKHAVAHNNRGATLDTLGRCEEALESFAKALAIQPDYAEALNNRGTALVDLDRLDEALASYEAALALDPDYVEGRWNKGLLQLRIGSLAEGWAGYEWRRRQDIWDPRDFAGPEWDGTAARGRRVLLYAEQALGDTLQFARFARTVAASGADVILEVQPPLAKLMQSLEGVTVVARGAPLPAFDCHLPLMSVPHVMRLPDVSADGPYLAAEPERTERWQRHLGGEGFRVGIAWRGNPKAPGPSRAIPLETFLPLARVPGVRLISLQKNDGVDELADLPDGMTIETLGAGFDSGEGAFLDTAAVMMSLDLVITSDTSIAHLAGALGRPVWIAMRHVTDWRWMADGEATPWYPTARLLKQTRRGDWGSVFERMASELVKIASGPPADDLAASPATPLVPISLGELIDKITILEIKSERIDDPKKSANIRRELDLLLAVPQPAPTAEAARLKDELKQVNEMLWEIEDQIRICEREQNFGPDFIALARSVYQTNDRRSAIKRQINDLSGSALVEEKSYSKYS
jgi:tetratricopeptide (TPR) repeat protein